MLGVTMCWNEQDCVATAIRCLLESDHDVHVFDHGSDDGTLDVLAVFGDDITIHEVDRQRVPFKRVFRHVFDWVAEQEAHDWVTVCEADEVLMPPGREPLRRHHIEAARHRGVQVIDPMVRRFCISHIDDQSESDHVKRMRHFVPAPGKFTPRGWFRPMTKKMPHGMHRRPWIPRDRRPRPPWPGMLGANGYWPKGAVISRDEWNLDHYPLRTVKQAAKKARNYPQGPGRHRYQAYLNGRASFVMEATELACIDGVKCG